VNDTPMILGDRYEVGDLLGRGGMAEVHLGRDARLGRGVAIKLLRTDLARDPVFQARFKREAQSAAGLNHPAIVAVYDTGEETVTESGGATVSLPYIVMEYVDGRTLRDLLNDGKPLDVDLALEVTSGVLSALEYSHRNGIVHRDIKPANVMITPSGDVKVMDFGIARALADASSTMTQTQAVIGTAQYLSPEQARGEAVDVRSDLYSAGCLLFELLTGRPPFVADSPVAVAYQHVREQPPPPSSLNPLVPPDVDRIVLYALTKDRDARYQTAGEFRADVEAARAGRKVTAPVVAAGGPPTGPTEYFPTYGTTGTQAGTLLAGTPADYDPYGADGAGGLGSRRDQRKDRRRGWGYALLALGVVAVLALVGFVVFRALDTGGNTTASTVPVPNVVGLSQSVAEQRLTALGLHTSANPQPCPDPANCDVGNVVKQDPASGTQLATGGTVTLTIAQAPNQVTVPDVTGQTQQDAISALEASGLALGGVTTEDSATVQKGRVIRTDPKADSQVDPGTRVTLIVASGVVTVPDVTGKSIDAARKQLNDLALQVNSLGQPSNRPEGTVLTQDHIGEVVQINTVIHLTYAGP